MEAMNRVVASGALAAFIAAMILIALASTGSDGTSSPVTTLATTHAATTAPTTTTPAPRPPIRIALVSVGSYDPPPGDGTERDSDVLKAVDGDPATFWSTEHYSSPLERYKQGVGIVLDAGRKRPIGRVLISTDDTTGSRAQIQLADSPTGPFRIASADHELVRTTSFRLKRGAAGRYVLVWVTAVSPATGEAHVTEVRALSR
jgi:hypothetical protein